MVAALGGEGAFVVHTEFAVDAKGEPVVVEVAARAPGALVSELARLHTGVNLEEVNLALQAGLPVPDPEPTGVQAAWVWVPVMPGERYRRTPPMGCERLVHVRQAAKETHTGTSGAIGVAVTLADMEAAHPSATAPHIPAADVAATARLTVHAPEEMQDLGRALAGLLRPGDLVMLTGELGAGKTTLTRGLGEGLGVRGAVTSPTFVIARVHPSLTGGPALVHVDAYRLGGGLDEMEDLDLDVSLPDSVVVVEWGEGKVEDLTEDRLHVVIDRVVGDTDDDRRQVTLTGVGERWAGVDLALV